MRVSSDNFLHDDRLFIVAPMEASRISSRRGLGSTERYRASALRLGTCKQSVRALQTRPDCGRRRALRRQRARPASQCSSLRFSCCSPPRTAWHVGRRPRSLGQARRVVLRAARSAVLSGASFDFAQAKLRARVERMSREPTQGSYGDRHGTAGLSWSAPSSSMERRRIISPIA